MLALGFADWTFWEAYNPPNFLGSQKVTFDGVNKLILVNEGVTELNFREDVYSGWKEWLKDPNHVNSGFAPAMSVTGGDPLPGSRSLGTTYFLENGWKLRTWEGNHNLTVTGNFFTRDGSDAFVPTILPWTITIVLNTSTLVETVIPETTLSAGDISAIALGVWEEPVDGAKTALEVMQGLDSDVWNFIIDISKNQSALEKLRKISTLTQDLALR